MAHMPGIWHMRSPRDTTRPCGVAPTWFTTFTSAFNTSPAYPHSRYFM